MCLKEPLKQSVFMYKYWGCIAHSSSLNSIVVVFYSCRECGSCDMLTGNFVWPNQCEYVSWNGIVQANCWKAKLVQNTCFKKRRKKEFKPPLDAESHSVTLCKKSEASIILISEAYLILTAHNLRWWALLIVEDTSSTAVRRHLVASGLHITALIKNLLTWLGLIALFQNCHL